MQRLYRKYPLKKEYACPAFQTDDGVGYPPVCRISFLTAILYNITRESKKRRLYEKVNEFSRVYTDCKG